MKLTPKEIEIMELLCQDKTAKQISDIQHRSIHTINAQIKSAKLKLGCSTDHGAVAKILAMKYGTQSL